MKSGLSFPRVFVPDGKTAFGSVKWEKKDCGEKDGFYLESVEVPASWSQIACDVAVGKYFRRRGVPGTESENSIGQMIYRVAHTIAEAGQSQGVFASPADRDDFEQELSHLLVEQKASFNSPVWFNCGIYHVYGIRSPGESHAWSPDENQIVRKDNIYEAPQGAACFIQEVKDDFDGLFDLLKREARIFKYGSGTGSNFSPIRGKNEMLSEGGKSAGLMAFLDVFDRAAGMVRSGGITRRAAKMVCIEVDHPEIREFIQWKVKEENKARQLKTLGLSGGLDGEIYRSVSGQNANHSVRVSNVFMRAAEGGGRFRTKARTSGAFVTEYSAGDVFREMAEAAWACGDPGLQYDDTIQEWNPCKKTMRINASNPCSEYMFVDNSACNLASVNLLKFFDEKNGMDWAGLEHAVRLLITAQEILVDLCGYPSAEIAENSHRYRPLGLGFTNLGALLMVMGFPYDSAKARAWASGIAAFLHGQALAVSSELAAVRGPFHFYEPNRSEFAAVLNRHAESLETDLLKSLPADVREKLAKLWKDMRAQVKVHGLRNAQVTAIAPTGTISLLMDCDTTGIEPEIAFVKRKNLVGGSALKLVNRSLQRSLAGLGYDGKNIAEIVGQMNAGRRLSEIRQLNAEHRPIFHSAVGAVDEEAISAQGHLLMMAAVQPFVSGAISKTVNLKESSTVDDVREIYMQAWRLGLKSIAVYRNKSKVDQPLEANVCFDCG